ncbi:hypothetical protein [Rubripirellula obstinata]|uniref:hypothetical protein n=1 Tax=Rubripirellula obstinata TaxID=406547 RepID=UPI0012FBF1A6|nr:hypothetical protein [Rubripirellula obstinata]
MDRAHPETPSRITISITGRRRKSHHRKQVTTAVPVHALVIGRWVTHRAPPARAENNAGMADSLDDRATDAGQRGVPPRG